MRAKLFEVRDHMTNMTMLAVSPHDGTQGIESQAVRQMWHREGYGSFDGSEGPRTEYVILGHAHYVNETTYDPYEHRNPRMTALHEYIIANWYDLENGQLLDIRVILGESAEPCESEYRR